MKTYHVKLNIFQVINFETFRKFKINVELLASQSIERGVSSAMKTPIPYPLLVAYEKDSELSKNEEIIVNLPENTFQHLSEIGTSMKVDIDVLMRFFISLGIEEIQEEMVKPLSVDAISDFLHKNKSITGMMINLEK